MKVQSENIPDWFPYTTVPQSPCLILDVILCLSCPKGTKVDYS